MKKNEMLPVMIVLLFLFVSCTLLTECIGTPVTIRECGKVVSNRTYGYCTNDYYRLYVSNPAHTFPVEVTVGQFVRYPNGSYIECMVTYTTGGPYGYRFMSAKIKE